MTPLLKQLSCRFIVFRIVGAIPLCAAIAVCGLFLPATPAAAQQGILESLRTLVGDSSTSTPHPAVAKVFVYDQDVVARGSGSLIHVAGDYGFLLTNWHVVRDAPQNVEVIFPNDFRTPATVLKMDQRWDLALLSIRAPEIAPIPLAQQIPQIGEPLTIAGYGSDQFRAARGTCMHFVSPEPQAPYEMIEVRVTARQGDSGGPILNERGELAAVLFGTGGGMTTGSHIGRVYQFLQEAREEAARTTSPLSPPTDVASVPQQPATARPSVDVPPPFHTPPARPDLPPSTVETQEARIDRAEIATQLQSLPGQPPANTPDGMVPIASDVVPEAETDMSTTDNQPPTPTSSPAVSEPTFDEPSVTDTATPEPAFDDSSPDEPPFAATPKQPTFGSAPEEPAATAEPSFEQPDFDASSEDEPGFVEADAAEPGFTASAPASTGPPALRAPRRQLRSQQAPMPTGSEWPPAAQADESTFAAVGTVPQLAYRENTAPAWRAAPYAPHHGAYGTAPPGEIGDYGLPAQETLTWSDLAGPTTWDKIKTFFALAGVVAVGYVLMHLNAK